MNTSHQSINFERIPQVRVKQLLLDNQLKSVVELSQLKSLPYDPALNKKFNKHYIEFVVDSDKQTLWNTYKTISPQQTWNGDMVSFGIMYSRKRNTITYADDGYSGLEAGQLLFLNLNLFAGLINLAVGHEVVDVDDSKNCVTICYLQNGASIGTQKFWIEQVSENKSKVVHETWYTSGSWLRDRVLYPGFHTKAICEFHNNVKREAEAKGNKYL